MTVGILFLFLKVRAFIVSLDFFTSDDEIDSIDKDQSGDYDYTNYDYHPDLDVSHGGKIHIKKRSDVSMEWSMRNDYSMNQTYFYKSIPEGNLRGSRTTVGRAVLPTVSSPSHSLPHSPFHSPSPPPSWLSSSSWTISSLNSTSTPTLFFHSLSGIVTGFSTLISSLLHSSLLLRRSATFSPLLLSHSVPFSSTPAAAAATSIGLTNMSVWGGLWGDRLQTLVGTTRVRSCELSLIASAIHLTPFYSFLNADCPLGIEYLILQLKLFRTYPGIVNYYLSFLSLPLSSPLYTLLSFSSLSTTCLSPLSS